MKSAGVGLIFCGALLAVSACEQAGPVAGQGGLVVLGVSGAQASALPPVQVQRSDLSVLQIAATSGADGSMTTWSADNLTRVGPIDPPREERRAVVTAARGEYASFQIVVSAPANAVLENVNVIAADLVGPGVISTSQMELFREHYVTVTHSTPLSPLAPGRFPDPLIPFVHPETGAALESGRFPTAPFPVPQAENQPVWVDILVPRDAAAGNYAGTFTVSADGQADETIDVELTVWDFELPEKPTLESSMGSFRGIRNNHGVLPGSAAEDQLRRRYADEMLRHRLVPAGEQWSYSSFSENSGSVQCTSAPDEFVGYFDKAWGENNLNIFTDWPWTDPTGVDRQRVVRYLRGLMQCYDALGYADRGAYMYAVDEPDTAEAYAAIRAWAEIAEEADPRIQLLVTEQPWPTEAEWGVLDGAVDIWVALFKFLDDPRIAERVAAGERVWGYPALVQGSPLLPHWQLDFPLINYRSPPWLTAQSGLTGILYYETTLWEQVDDPWTDPGTFNLGGGVANGGYSFNGDGMMIYPGSAINYDGPVVSLRMKVLRDGMEDWEYIHALRVRGLIAEADAIMARVSRSWTDWSRDPADYYRARAQAAELIQQYDQINGPPSQ